MIYIAYGSNINLDQMKRRCPKSQLIGNSFLENCKLTFRGRGHANIEESFGSRVPVVLWRLSKACEKELDGYEDYPNYYLKNKEEINYEGKKVDGLIYVMRPELASKKISPENSYVEIIRQGYKQNNLDLSILNNFLQEDL